MHTDRRTDMTQAIGAFRDYASEKRGRLLKLNGLLHVIYVFHVNMAVVVFRTTKYFSLL
jgi:hypothetical protein